MLKNLSREIVGAGVRHIFGIPGSGNSLKLLDNLQGYGIDIQITHFEGSGAIIAASCGLVSNSLGVVLAIKGPGVANLVPGLAVCSFEDIPLIAISEAPGPTAHKSTVHKRLNHQSLTREVTKGSLRLDSASGEGFLQASAIAREETPGPVLLELVDNPDNADVFKSRVKEVESQADRPTSLDRLLAEIKKSRKPIIIAGSPAYRAACGVSLGRLRIPIFTTLAAKGLVDELDDYSAGVYTGAGGENAPETRVLAQTDLVIGIGLRGKELLKFSPFGCPAVNLDFSRAKPTEGHEFVVNVGIESVEEVFYELTSKEWGAELVADSISKLRSQLLSVGFLPATVLEVVSKQLSGACQLVVDTGLFCTVAEHIWQSRKYGEFLCSSNGRYMGTAVPMAIGASIGAPHQPTVLVTGDGGIGMYFAEFRIAIERALPVLVLFFSDGGFGSIGSVAEKQQIDASIVRINNPSWAASLRSLGMDGVIASCLEHVSDGLNSWDKSGGPIFIECRFDPDQYRCMVDKIR
jgi:acetolactate synthase I/II/III large subunit